jgi:fumarate reductase flavoprotein subunit
VTTTTARLPLRADLPERVGVRVLGSGLAGCAALLAAAEAGRPAVMLEKTDAIGGSTVKSGALVAFSGTDEQRAQGITDSVDLLRRDLLEAGQYRNDELLVDLYCSQQLDTYRWLRSHGVVYGDEVHAGSGPSVASPLTPTCGCATGGMSRSSACMPLARLWAASTGVVT